jgi:predicted aspartyl protease
MGLTYIEGTATGPTGKKVNLQFMVDSGATYTLLPEKDWLEIQLKPTADPLIFTLADGTKMEREVSKCLVSLPQGEYVTPVILGKGDDEALLGAVTLEELRLILNPFNRQLQPMRMMLA